jgi:hypothetical protein
LFPDSVLNFLTEEEAPYIENLLQLSADCYRKRRDLKTDSSAGISAWTPGTIQGRMLDQRGKVGHNAETGLKHQFIMLSKACK